MGAGGRRGSAALMYEIIISLVLLGLFTWATMTYITKNANGEQYFSRFYAADLASSAEVVAAGYGDVTLRYDNLRPGNNLKFQFTNGTVAVGSTKMDIPAYSHYGTVSRFDEATYANPSFLVIKKVEEGLSVRDLQTTAESCPKPAKQTPLANAAVYLQGSDAAKASFRQALRSTPITVTDDATAATIKLTIVTAAGENRVSFSPTNDEGRSLSCYFMQRLGALSIDRFEAGEPTQSAADFSMTITITKRADVILTDEQIGRALALALVVYYR